MDFFNNIGNFLNSDNPLAKLANNTISNMTASPKSAPVSYSAPAPQVITLPAQTGMSQGTMLGIGAVVLGVLGVLIFTFTRK